MGSEDKVENVFDLVNEENKNPAPLVFDEGELEEEWFTPSEKLMLIIATALSFYGIYMGLKALGWI